MLSGRKAGATHPLPLGELTIGTTLDDEFFIGCVDMWHQLLLADASANSRSATASVDARPEQMVQATLIHTPTGMTLKVKAGFAEIGDKRLLPGDSAIVPLDMAVRLGSSRLEIQPVRPRGNVGSLQQKSNSAKYRWLDSKVAFTGITALAVAGLSATVLINPPAGGMSNIASLETTEAIVFAERVVAVVSTSPEFLVTENGQRYEIGAKVDEGYEIVSISSSSIELQRGAERRRMAF